MKLVVLTSALVFAIVTALVASSIPVAFDDGLLLALRSSGNSAEPIGGPWFQDAVRDVTGLGSFMVLTLVTVAAFVALVTAKRVRTALYFVLIVVSGQMASETIKSLVDRARPTVVPRLALASNQSFPSGHSMLSMIVYLALGLLVLPYLASRPLRYGVIAMSVVLALIVGSSRVYLGVHYPTDVLGGWSLGLAWLGSAELIARAVNARGVANGSGPAVRGSPSASARPES